MIYISDSLMQQIKKDAQECYPNECCGILFGSLKEERSMANGKGNNRKTQMVKQVKNIQPIQNSFADTERYHRFLITPEIMMQAELLARKNQQDIVGFYHSHPDHPAVPSEYDREHALPVYSYIIVSVVSKTAVALNSFELSTEGKTSLFYSEDIRIE